MMDPRQVVDEFLAYLKDSAAKMSYFGAKISTYSDSTSGTTYQGFEIEYEDYPRVEFNNPSWRPINRKPTSKEDLYYWGGKWGHRILFLTMDGRLFECEFKGEDILEGMDIRTITQYRVLEVPLSRLLKGTKPFAETRQKIDKRLTEAYIESL